MAILKTKDIREMSNEERMKKIQELKFELIKAMTQKTGNLKIKEIKKTIARMLTINSQENKKLKQELKNK